MTTKELKKKYFDFFIKKGHKKLPNVSLVPENDPSALFISAGMHPLVPYLMGEPHPLGKRLVSLQRCLRTTDIEEVGDVTYNSFFEMLGNWSLGGYWKKEAISWSYEFLTKELRISPGKLNVTCFAGDKDAPKDEESAAIWKSLGIPSSRIYFLGKEDNWWGPAGRTGPCGPDTEMFVDTGKKPCGKNCQPGCHCGKYFEVWNDVFMEYNKTREGKYEPLKQKNVDTGMGVERTTAMLQAKDDIYETELFSPIITVIEKISDKKYEGENKKPMRIIADHLRAAVFVIADGIEPSNVEQGYVLRRLIRRTIINGRNLEIERGFTTKIASVVVQNYQGEYPNLKENERAIERELKQEEEKFFKTLSEYKISKEASRVEEQAKKIKEEILDPKEVVKASEFSKYKDQLGDYESFLEKHPFISTASGAAGTVAFDQKTTFGIPIEGTRSTFDRFIDVNDEIFNKTVNFWRGMHQNVSRASQEKKFAGGLADHSEEVTKFHTATHLLQAALRQVLGEEVLQKGSNITAKRLRFDFSGPRKLTEEELESTEKLVNQVIKKNLPVKMETMSFVEAKKKGAIAVFGQKYGEEVKVYSIGPSTSSGQPFSVEVCGGPHVDFTRKLGRFKIIRQEAVGAGVRRLYAVLE
jgi:alanyl-tRNA synthetase